MDAKDQMQTERGVVLVAILTVLVRLVLLVGAFASTMLGHNSALQTELDQEIALLAAEAGVDEAIHEGRIGALTDGARITRDLGWGQTFDLDATYLRSDARDNDSDGDIDEEDEDVFQVVVSGRYRGATRRLAAYLGPVPLLPRMDAAFSTQDPSISIRLSGVRRYGGFADLLNRRKQVAKRSLGSGGCTYSAHHLLRVQGSSRVSTASTSESMLWNVARDNISSSNSTSKWSSIASITLTVVNDVNPAS